MDALEKKVLKAACNNLRRATIIPDNFSNIQEYTEWIRNANRAAMDLVNIADTLINNENYKTNEPIQL